MYDIRLLLEKKVIKQMNFGVIPIEGCSCAFQDECIKIPDFSIKAFDRGDKKKTHRAAFPD